MVETLLFSFPYQSLVLMFLGVWSNIIIYNIFRWQRRFSKRPLKTQNGRSFRHFAVAALATMAS